MHSILRCAMRETRVSRGVTRSFHGTFITPPVVDERRTGAAGTLAAGTETA